MTGVGPETRKAVEAALARIFRERLLREVPGADVDLFEAGAIDSVAFVELLLAVEEELGVRVDLERLDLDDLRTLSSIARVLVRSGAAA